MIRLHHREDGIATDYKNIMRKVIIFILFNLALSITCFCQVDGQEIEVDTIIIDCRTIPLDAKYLMIIKDYELKIDSFSTEIYGEIEHNCLKDVTVIKAKGFLEEMGYEEDDTLVIVRFEDSKWEKLPKKLREEFFKSKL